MASSTVTAPRHRQANPAESQQEFYTRLGATLPPRRMLAAVCARWVTSRRAAAVAFATARRETIPHILPPPRGGEQIPPGAGMFIALAGAELPLSSRDRHRGCPVATGVLGRPLSLTVVRPGTVEGAPRRLFGPIVHARWRPWVRSSTGSSLNRTNTPRGGTFLVRCGLAPRQGEADRLCIIPAGGGLSA